MREPPTKEMAYAMGLRDGIGLKCHPLPAVERAKLRIEAVRCLASGGNWTPHNLIAAYYAGYAAGWGGNEEVWG